MDLYLDPRIDGGTLCKTAAQTGESRGGSYVKRVQTGIEKDGSPKYKYFQSIEDYKKYIEDKGDSIEREAKRKKDSKKLADKLEDQQESSKEAASKKGKKDKKPSVVSKSLDLFLYLEI